MANEMAVAAALKRPRQPGHDSHGGGDDDDDAGDRELARKRRKLAPPPRCHWHGEPPMCNDVRAEVRARLDPRSLSALACVSRVDHEETGTAHLGPLRWVIRVLRWQARGDFVERPFAARDGDSDGDRDSDSDSDSEGSKLGGRLGLDHDVANGWLFVAFGHLTQRMARHLVRLRASKSALAKSVRLFAAFGQFGLYEWFLANSKKVKALNWQVRDEMLIDVLLTAVRADQGDFFGSLLFSTDLRLREYRSRVFTRCIQYGRVDMVRCMLARWDTKLRARAAEWFELAFVSGRVDVLALLGDTWPAEVTAAQALLRACMRLGCQTIMGTGCDTHVDCIAWAARVTGAQPDWAQIAQSALADGAHVTCFKTALAHVDVVSPPLLRDIIRHDQALFLAVVLEQHPVDDDDAGMRALLYEAVRKRSDGCIRVLSTHGLRLGANEFVHALLGDAQPASPAQPWASAFGLARDELVVEEGDS